MSRLPLIGVTACTKQIGFYSYPIEGDKHVRALVVGAGGLLPAIPALGDLLDLSASLANPDGLLFSRSPSNVEPHHPLDASPLPLIKAAIAAGVPLLGIGPRSSVASRVAGSRKFASPRTLSAFQAFGEACRKRASQR